MFFLSAAFWGWYADRSGRRRAIIWTAILTIPIAPLYLLTTNYVMIVIFFTIQGAFGGGGMHVQHPHYLSERFLTEVWATAAGFATKLWARDRRRACRPDPRPLRDLVALGLCDPDADRNHGRVGVADPGDAVQSGDPRHGIGFRYRAGVSPRRNANWADIARPGNA